MAIKVYPLTFIKSTFSSIKPRLKFYQLIEVNVKNCRQSCRTYILKSHAYESVLWHQKLLFWLPTANKCSNKKQLKAFFDNSFFFFPRTPKMTLILNSIQEKILFMSHWKLLDGINEGIFYHLVSYWNCIETHLSI